MFLKKPPKETASLRKIMPALSDYWKAIMPKMHLQSWQEPKKSKQITPVARPPRCLQNTNQICLSDTSQRGIWEHRPTQSEADKAVSQTAKHESFTQTNYSSDMQHFNFKSHYKTLYGEFLWRFLKQSESVRAWISELLLALQIISAYRLRWWCHCWWHLRQPQATRIHMRVLFKMKVCYQLRGRH